ncbi:hypothetical protein BD626DRAFT_404921, partial [Schizophyllum amplum]
MGSPPPPARHRAADREDVPTRGRGPGRISQLASEVNTGELLTKLLKQPVTSTFGEILGLSKELANGLNERTKPSVFPRPQTAINWLEPMPAAVAAKKKRALALRPGDDALIKIFLEFGDRIVEAIIDTGSQLNVMNGDLAD